MAQEPAGIGRRCRIIQDVPNWSLTVSPATTSPAKDSPWNTAFVAPARKGLVTRTL